MTWAATEAKAKFSEVLDRAESEGPQMVRRRRREFYVIATDDANKTGKQADTLGSQANRAASSLDRPLVNAWEALAPSFMEREDTSFPRLKGKLRKVNLG